MKSKTLLFYTSRVYGVIITFLLFFAFVPKLVKSTDSIMDILRPFAHWYDDPTAFCLTYFTGYAMIWWKPLRGSIIIILGGVVFFIFNPGNMGFLTTFLTPTFLVAVLYILWWIAARKKD